MKIVNYPKLKNFFHFEEMIEPSNFMVSTFNLFNPPLNFYKAWHNKYLQDSNKTVLHSTYFWDSLKSHQGNQSELFKTIDLLIYFIQPFDFSHCKNWNPVSYFNKVKCHSEDLTVITFRNYDNEKVISEFQFKRGKYLKMNLHSFLDHILEYAYNKIIKIEIRYELSPEGINYFSVIENQLSLVNKYDMKIYESVIKNVYFMSKLDIEKIPSNHNEEISFILTIEDHLHKLKIFEENLYFIQKFKKNLSIEYLFLLNADFQNFEDKKTLKFEVLSHKVLNFVFQNFIKAFY